jgi:hypothetical protein
MSLIKIEHGKSSIEIREPNALEFLELMEAIGDDFTKLSELLDLKKPSTMRRVINLMRPYISKIEIYEGEECIKDFDVLLTKQYALKSYLAPMVGQFMKYTVETMSGEVMKEDKKKD